MRVPEEPVCIDLFRQNPVFTSLHLKSPVHVHRLRQTDGKSLVWFGEIERKLAKLSKTTFTYRSSSLLFYAKNSEDYGRFMDSG
jgi:hypothetical protein